MEIRKFPGPISSAILKDAGAYYATNTMGSRICVKRRFGAIVEDHDGFRFVDFHCDASVNNLGGNHPKIYAALQAQINTGNYFSEHHCAPNSDAIELAKLLAKKSPVHKPAKVYFGNSGTEANETALKLCRAFRKERGEHHRQTVIYFRNAFHGRTLGILPGTNSKPELQRDSFWTQWDREHSIHLPYPAKGHNYSLLEYFSTLNPATISALFIELPCQGEGGIIPADMLSVRHIYEQTLAKGILFIIDAIQCGMGRTGHLFGLDPLYSEWLKPDIMTLGKALGGGLPIGAAIFRAELDFRKPGMHSSTFGGGPLVAKAALAAVSEIETLLLNNTVGLLQARMHHALTNIQKKFPALIAETRGVGAMWAHEIISPEFRNLIIERCEEVAETEEYGLRLLSAGEKTVRFMPPLNISADMLNFGFSLYEKVLSSL